MRLAVLLFLPLVLIGGCGFGKAIRKVDLALDAVDLAISEKMAEIESAAPGTADGLRAELRKLEEDRAELRKARAKLEEEAEGVEGGIDGALMLICGLLGIPALAGVGGALAKKYIVQK